MASQEGPYRAGAHEVQCSGLNCLVVALAITNDRVYRILSLVLRAVHSQVKSPTQIIVGWLDIAAAARHTHLMALRAAIKRFRFDRLPETERVKLWPGLGRVGEDVRLTGFPNFGSEPFLISLGSHITISDDVAFVNHDGGARVFRRERPGLHVYNKITVGDNVFIGMGTIILPGVTIGDNTVIGARSVVSRDIPPRSVAVGAPCRVIKSLDEYRASVEKKGMDWPVGDYGEAWRETLIANYW